MVPSTHKYRRKFITTKCYIWQSFSIGILRLSKVFQFKIIWHWLHHISVDIWSMVSILWTSGFAHRKHKRNTAHVITSSKCRTKDIYSQLWLSPHEECAARWPALTLTYVLHMISMASCPISTSLHQRQAENEHNFPVLCLVFFFLHTIYKGIMT